MAYDFGNNGKNESGYSNYPANQPGDYYRYPNNAPYTRQSFQAPAPLNSNEPAKPQKSRKAGKAIAYVASLLAVGVISGAAGGGITYQMIMKNAETAPLTQESSVVAQEPGSAENAPTPAIPVPSSDQDAGGIAGVVEKASGSVVEISVQVTTMNPFYGEMATEGSGSGIIFTEDGYIITNNHVIADASAIKVRTKDGTEYEGTLVGTDTQTDLAIIKIDAKGLPPVTLADSALIRVGETAIAIGNPLGTLGGTVTSGIISALNREITIGNETMSLIQTSAAVNPGNSGGGLFDGNGDLIGIVNAKSSSSSYGETSIEGLGFAIPSNQVKLVADDIIANGYVTGRVELGINVLEISDTQAAFYYRVNEYGVYILDVTRENGLQRGDLIVSIEGETIETGADVKAALEGRSVGDTLTLIVKRGGNEISVSVTLAEKIPAYIQERRQAGKDI